VLAVALVLLAIVPAEARQAAGIEVLLDTTNAAVVRNGTSRPSVLKLAAPRLITLIQTYHWNGGRGASAGWISLRGQDGKQYGPWRAASAAGQGGVPNVFWSCSPSTVLPSGSYTVLVSDAASWSSNAESKGRGFVRVEGSPPPASRQASQESVPKPPQRPASEPALSPSATGRDDARVLVAALAFRDAAALSFAGAVQRPDRRAAFAALLASEAYRQDPYPWSHFFGGTFVLLGRAAGGGAVAAFYNPYYDVAALTHWELQDREPRMSRAAVVDGARFRGETAAVAPMPAWLGTQVPLARSLPAQGAAFISAFERRFPASAAAGAGRGLPADDRDAVARVQQLGAIQTAALVALDDGTLPDLSAADLALRAAFTRGDEATLRAHLPTDNSVSAAELLQLPHALRGTLLPTTMFPGRGLALIVLTNPEMPRFGVATMYQTTPEVRLRSVSVLDLLGGAGP
jgi:hypothetical protein